MSKAGQNYLIIAGAAPNLHVDIAAVPRSGCCDYDFMAIGFDVVDKLAWPILYMATYHPEDIPEARARRERFGGNTDYQVISMEKKEGVDIVIPFKPPSGSSALLGTLAAFKLGYKRIILCGCPLDGKNIKGGSYESFRIGWEAAEKEMNDRVRSMSGWTRDFLGAPTDEWLLTG